MKQDYIYDEGDDLLLKEELFNTPFCMTYRKWSEDGKRYIVLHDTAVQPNFLWCFVESESSRSGLEECSFDRKVLGKKTDIFSIWLYTDLNDYMARHKAFQELLTGERYYCIDWLSDTFDKETVFRAALPVWATKAARNDDGSVLFFNDVEIVKNSLGEWCVDMSKLKPGTDLYRDYLEDIIGELEFFKEGPTEIINLKEDQ